MRVVIHSQASVIAIINCVYSCCYGCCPCCVCVKQHGPIHDSAIGVLRNSVRLQGLKESERPPEDEHGTDSWRPERRDFNPIMDADLDSQVKRQHSSEPAAKILRRATKEIGIVDVWRILNHTEKNYTFYSKSHDKY